MQGPRQRAAVVHGLPWRAVEKHPNLGQYLLGVSHLPEWCVATEIEIRPYTILSVFEERS